MVKKENKRLVHIKATTWAIFQGSLSAVLGLGVAVLHSMRVTVKMADSTESVLGGLAFGLATGVVSLFVLPFVYFAIGWIVGLVQAWFYNLVLGVSGGVVVELKDE